MLQTDIDQLNRVVTLLDGVSSAIDGLDVRTSANTLKSSIPGCAVIAECILGAEYIEGAYLRMAERLRQVSRLTAASAANYQVTEAEFQRRLRELDVQPGGPK